MLTSVHWRLLFFSVLERYPMIATLVFFLAGVVNAEPPPRDEDVQQFEEQTYEYTGGEYHNEPFKYRLLKPLSIEPGKLYPVILFLHGAGERGSDNIMQIKHFPEVMVKPENREKYACFLVVPQCRTDKKWVDRSWSSFKSQDMPAEPSDQMKVAIGALDYVMKTYPCDPDRVYLTGISMGGYGSWDLAARMPERFAAVSPICGGGDDKQAGRLVNLPIWAWHGDVDTAVPVSRSREMIAAIEKAGGHPKYTELPGVGHNSWTTAYTRPDGVIPWLFEQVRKPANP